MYVYKTKESLVLQNVSNGKPSPYMLSENKHIIKFHTSTKNLYPSQITFDRLSMAKGHSDRFVRKLPRASENEYEILFGKFSCADQVYAQIKRKTRQRNIGAAHSGAITMLNYEKENLKTLKHVVFK